MKGAETAEKKRDSIYYLLGALTRLIGNVDLSIRQLNFIYNLLDVMHKFIEGYE